MQQHELIILLTKNKKGEAKVRKNFLIKQGFSQKNVKLTEKQLKTIFEKFNKKMD
jgi:hypothetical protein